MNQISNVWTMDQVMQVFLEAISPPPGFEKVRGEYFFDPEKKRITTLLQVQQVAANDTQKPAE